MQKLEYTNGYNKKTATIKNISGLEFLYTQKSSSAIVGAHRERKTWAIDICWPPEPAESIGQLRDNARYYASWYMASYSWFPPTLPAKIRPCHPCAAVLYNYTKLVGAQLDNCRVGFDRLCCWKNYPLPPRRLTAARSTQQVLHCFCPKINSRRSLARVPIYVSYDVLYNRLC